MTYRELILHCAEVNARYMRLPAGKIKGFEAVVSLYDRIARQSLRCARAWVEHKPCPDHEAAVSALWWGIVAWADVFGVDAEVEYGEWKQVFISPHLQFAQYLRPNQIAEVLPLVGGSPAHIILEMDVLWMKHVINLTARWGLWHHLRRDWRALLQARRLMRESRSPGSPAYRAYLESDIEFFRILFKPFPFTETTRRDIEQWLNIAESEI